MNGCKPDDHHPQAQMKQIFQEGKLKTGDKKTIKEFSQKYIVSEKPVADYIGNPTHNEMRKDKCRTDNDRKHAQKSNRNTKTLSGKISITETSCHLLCAGLKFRV